AVMYGVGGVLALAYVGVGVWLATLTGPPSTPYVGDPYPGVAEGDDGLYAEEPYLGEGVVDASPLASGAAPSHGGRQGDWFVIAGGSTDPASSDITDRYRELNQAGISDAYTIDSNAYPNLTPGLTVIVVGPFTQAEARMRLRAVQTVVADAYIKSGW
ncbi:MAG: hypothetical protein AAFQ43_04875, partial [Bacteroidota bacterium]